MDEEHIYIGSVILSAFIKMNFQKHPQCIDEYAYLASSLYSYLNYFCFSDQDNKNQVDRGSE